MTFGLAVATCLAGHPVVRPGWLNANWRLEARSPGGLTAPILCCVTAGNGPIYPWGPTEDDMFATDWAPVNEDASPVDPAPGSFGALLPSAMGGCTLKVGKLRVHVEETDFGSVLVATLPTGTRRLWRPQIQDLTRTDWAVV